jgi:putative membrane protein insertion efficiency factor
MLRGSLDKVNQVLRGGLIIILKGYQYLISPLLGNRCRFYPSCSHYALEALRQHNLMQGSYLIFRRLLRCHPFHPGGFDPVIKTNETEA